MMTPDRMQFIVENYSRMTEPQQEEAEKEVADFLSHLSDGIAGFMQALQMSFDEMISKLERAKRTERILDDVINAHKDDIDSEGIPRPLVKIDHPRRPDFLN